MTNKSETNQKAVLVCNCGCEGTTKGGKYLPGHDAKHKKQLIDEALRGSKRAEAKLEKLGWLKFLEAKKQATKEGGDMRQTTHGSPSESKPPKHRGNSSHSGAAKAAREFLPTLNPPLSEHSARIFGFGHPPAE